MPSADTDDAAIEATDLRKTYGSEVALEGLSLSIPRGTVYGFLGPNGAGKTTTMRIGLVVATRQASGLRFTDHANDSETRPVRTSTGGFTAPRPFAWTKAGRIGWERLVRGIRSPQEFSYLVLILSFVGPMGTTVVQSSGDALGPLIAGYGVGLGTYLAGATFGLNPFGDDRPQIPLLL